MTKKCQKQAEAKRDGVINPQDDNFSQFKTRKFSHIDLSETISKLYYHN